MPALCLILSGISLTIAGALCYGQRSGWGWFFGFAILFFMVGVGLAKQLPQDDDGLDVV